MTRFAVGWVQLKGQYLIQEHVTLAWHYSGGQQNKIMWSSYESGLSRRKPCHYHQQLKLPNRSHDPVLFEKYQLKWQCLLFIKLLQWDYSSICNSQRHLPSFLLFILDILAYTHIHIAVRHQTNAEHVIKAMDQICSWCKPAALQILLLHCWVASTGEKKKATVFFPETKETEIFT